MVRTVLSLAALASLLILQPQAALAAQGKASARAAAKPSTTATVNLNTASATDFQGLPGIGAKTAARIIEYRQKNGPFKKVEDILETSRSCPSLLSISCMRAHPSVARHR